jgi:hypothetical protein
VETFQKRYSAFLSQTTAGAGLDLEGLTAGLDILADKHLPDDIAILVITRQGNNE